jgi:hypothetical protein
LDAFQKHSVNFQKKWLFWDLIDVFRQKALKLRKQKNTELVAKLVKTNLKSNFALCRGKIKNS